MNITKKAEAENKKATEYETQVKTRKIEKVQVELNQLMLSLK